MRRVGVDTAWAVLLTTGTVLLMVLLVDAGAQPTSYHIALPTMPASFTTSPKVAVLHSSDLTTGQPVATTPDTGCTVTAGNPIVLGSDCVGLLPQGVGVDTVGIHVTHTDSFRLHVIPTSLDGTNLGDGFLAVPDVHLGDEYFVVTYCSLGGTCQFSIVGTVDNTSVSVEFPVNVDTATICIGGSTVVSPGTETPFTLHENDVLHFESSFDLSGTYITSDQNVAVFSGGYDDVNTNGQLYEQLLPTRKWSKSYVIMPNDLNDAGDIVKIMPQLDFTEIHITGYSTFMMSEKGKAVERRIDWRMFSEITATKPIQAVQIMGMDLYNDTANVGGPRAMVHLQSRNQWLTTGTVACSNVASDVSRSMVNLFGELGNAPPVGTHANTLTPTQIQGTDTYVSIYDKEAALSAEDLTLGATFGQVGYCVYGTNESASAMLLSNNLDLEDSVSCAPSLSTPGDDLDNDCDEEHDEEPCVLADLTRSHNSVEDTTGYSTQYSREIAFDGYLKFKVQTCDVAEVLMWCSTESGPHVSLQISSTGLHMHVEGGASGSTIGGLSDACAASQAFWLEWTKDGASGSVDIKAGSGLSRTGTQQISVTTTEHDCFDWLTFHTLSGNALFDMESGKDCGKIISGTAADNYGFEFVVPIPNTDTFKLYVTGIDATATNVHLRHPQDVAMAYTGATSGGNLTIETSEVTPTTTTYTHLILTADAEVSVFATGETPGPFQYGVQLLPTDVLGPAYPSVKIEAVSSDTVCKVFSTDRQLDIADVTPPTVTEFMSQTFTQNAEDPRLFFNAKQVMPVFCGDFKKAVMQIPPRETMGRNFYVPAINFGGLPEISKAWISIVTLEDSTYVKILGDYDREDIVDLRYSHYDRPLSWGANKYTIETNKNVLAYLELQFDDTRDVIALPPTDQYKSTTRFPATSGTILNSWVITDAGVGIGSQLTASSVASSVQDLTYASPTFMVAVVEIDSVKHNHDLVHWVITDAGVGIGSQLTASSVASSVQDLTYASPTFMVAVVEIDSVKHNHDLVHWAITDAGTPIVSQLTASSVASSVQDLTYTAPTFMVAVVEIDGVKHIMTSDFGLVDNEMCVISDIPADNVDDDCDGLVDEDVCYVVIVPGEIDSDIDGSINDDCDPGVPYDPYSITTPTLNIDHQHIECGGFSSTVGTVPTSGPTVPTTTMPITSTSVTPATAPTLPTETLPTYAPIDFKENATASVSINTTTSGNSTTLSLCDGVCPCGWVDPPNMTEAELMIKVEQIQEKLKIQKTELSAWVRKKTSAQDNRPSATAVGSAGVTFLVVCMAAIGILDMTTLARDVRMLRDNLRQACEMG